MRQVVLWAVAYMVYWQQGRTGGCRRQIPPPCAPQHSQNMSIMNSIRGQTAERREINSFVYFHVTYVFGTADCNVSLIADCIFTFLGHFQINGFSFAISGLF